MTISTVAVLVVAVVALSGTALGSDGDSAYFGGRGSDVRGAYDMPLTLLTPSEAGDGLCLDGSVPGFYFQAANDTAHSDSWVLYFKGGGWCYDQESCAKRANTSLGSSKHFSKYFGFAEGPVSGDPVGNPNFHSFNRVILWYCDGASFSGARSGTVPFGTQELYFRGKLVLDAMLNVLLTKHGLAGARNVLLSGGSAGGLSTFLHADYVGKVLAAHGVEKFKAAPVSGFFLLHNAGDRIPLYPNEMVYVAKMQNSTSGLNADCVASLSASEHWRCIFANYSYAHTQTPIFVLNSVTDAWQMGNVFPHPGDADWKACVKPEFPGPCTPAVIAELNGYAQDFMHDMIATSTYTKNGNGAFLDTCLEHCAAQGTAWMDYTLKGTTMRDAVWAWWESSDEPSSKHTHLPGCSLNDQPPHQCMPSCCKDNKCP